MIEAACIGISTEYKNTQKRAPIDWVLNLIVSVSKNMPRKKKKAYRKQQFQLLLNEIDSQIYARNI